MNKILKLTLAEHVQTQFVIHELVNSFVINKNKMADDGNFSHDVFIGNFINVHLIFQNLGKGSLWMVDPLYRSNLMQALKKAPYHPCSSFDKAYSKPPLSPVR